MRDLRSEADSTYPDIASVAQGNLAWIAVNADTWEPFEVL